MESYKNLIKEIETYIVKLESASLTMDELFELEKLTRKLHERSIILKYKAFENKVGEKTAVKKKEEASTGTEQKFVAEESVEEATEPESLEFAMFNIAEDVGSQEPNLVFGAPEASDEIPEEEESIAPTAKAQQSEDKQTKEKDEPETKKKEEDEGSESFLDKFRSVDNSLSSQFAGSKITTLVGAFGLNEKLRFINDLFDGSSENFSDAVKALDSKDSLNEATLLVEELAGQHSWDPEEEVVSEFMTYINRRYA